MSRRELAARKGARAPATLPPPAAVARESRGGRRRRRLTSLQSRLGVARRRAAGPPQAGSALGDARCDGAADMAPLKPRTTRAPRAGRAPSEPGEVTWLHTFDCFWSPSPEGGAGQVRSRVRAARLRGLAPGTSRVWGRGPGGGVEQPARGRWRGARSASAASSSASVRFPHSAAWPDALMWPRGCLSAFLRRRGQVPKRGGVGVETGWRGLQHWP